MEGVESPLEVLSRAATMVQHCRPYVSISADKVDALLDAADSANIDAARPDISPDAPDVTEEVSAASTSGTKQLPTAKWRRDRRATTRLPGYKPKEHESSGMKATRSQSLRERRAAGAGRAATLSDGDSPPPRDKPAPPYEVAKAWCPVVEPALVESVSGALDMRVCARGSPPPYRAPAALATHVTIATPAPQAPPTTGSMSMCDPVIDEHFRRSLGADYVALFGKKQSPPSPPSPPAQPKPPTKDRGSSPIMFASDPCTDFLATNGLANIRKDDQISTETTNGNEADVEMDNADMSVDEHFAKALGETWKKIQEDRLKTDKVPENGEKTNGVKGDAASSKIISRRGVVI